MNEIGKTNMTDQNWDWLNFNSEINQRKLCSKTLNKYVAVFDYIDKFLIALSATSGRVCIIFCECVSGAPVEIAGANFTL